MLYFFFNDTATTEIYTLSLHDALPISDWPSRLHITYLSLSGEAIHLAAAPTVLGPRASVAFGDGGRWTAEDRKSTRLNSSHANISYAVFCLKKKKTIT